MRLIAFDYFRGIAILFIVARHTTSGWTINSFPEAVLINLISGGTFMFVFISGFFFHHIYYEKFCFRRYITKKAKYIFLPYLILSLAWFFYFIFSSKSLPYADALGIYTIDSSINYTKALAMYLWTGRITIAYWFIPFVITMFIISPFFIRYIKLSTVYRMSILITWLIISATIIHRPSSNLAPLQSVLFYTPIYLLGINISIHNVAVIEFLKGKEIVIGLVVILLAIIQTWLQWNGISRDNIMLFNNRFDFIVFQKIVMCFFFLSVFQKYKDRRIPFLKLLASASFAIFFIHPGVIMMFTETGILLFMTPLPGFVIFVVTCLLTVLVSLLFSYIVKLILKEKSRYVIGW